MAEIETSFVTHIKAQSAIKALVGSRVYEYEPDELARKPNIYVRPVTNPRASWTQTAYGGVARLSIYINADTEAKAREVAAAVLTVYRQFSGTLGSHTVNYVEVSNARTLFGPGREKRFLVDLVVHYKE